MPPLLSLSIISHGDLEKVQVLIKSIALYENTKNLEIIVTDNLGENGFQEKLPQNIVFLRNHAPLGFAQNHNQALQRARGEYFCILNPDILFTESVFEPLIAHIENRQADILAPLVVDSQNIIQDSFRNLPKPSEIIARRLGKKEPVRKPSEPISPDWLAGMFLLMRTDTFRALGGFDEGYHLYFEDVDFCTRARLAGLRIVLDPSLRIQHDAHRASKKQIHYLYWHLQSAIRFFSSQVYKDAKKLD